MWTLSGSRSCGKQRRRAKQKQEIPPHLKILMASHNLKGQTEDDIIITAAILEAEMYAPLAARAVGMSLGARGHIQTCCKWRQLHWFQPELYSQKWEIKGSTWFLPPTHPIFPHLLIQVQLHYLIFPILTDYVFQQFTAFRGFILCETSISLWPWALAHKQSEKAQISKSVKKVRNIVLSLC